MKRHHRLLVGGLALLAVLHIAQAASAQPPAAPAAPAAAAAKASPELVAALSSEIGATPEQSAGAAGALFGLAKSRLKPNDFSQVANAVPGMDLLLKAAPAAGGAGSSALSQLGQSATGLAGMASAFGKLGLKPELVAKAVPVLVSFVSKTGGAGVGNLLAGVLK